MLPDVRWVGFNPPEHLSLGSIYGGAKTLRITTLSMITLSMTKGSILGQVQYFWVRPKPPKEHFKLLHFKGNPLPYSLLSDTANIVETL